MNQDYEGLEQLCVQLLEALRFSLDPRPPRQRLALLLLDNAAESLLNAAIRPHLQLADQATRTVNQIQRHVAAGMEEPTSSLEYFKRHTLSKRKRLNIDRNFGDKVDYLQEQDPESLSIQRATALKHLHHYRNRAYHHDDYRLDTLRPGVRIYFNLCLGLFRNTLNPITSPFILPPGIAEVFGDSVPDLSQTFNIADRVCAEFETTLNLDDKQLALDLSEHFMARLLELTELIEENAGTLEMSLAKCLEIIRKGPDANPFERASSEEIASSLSSYISMAQVGFYIRHLDSALDALDAFATEDNALQVLESRADELAMAIDREIQLQIDLARGK